MADIVNAVLQHRNPLNAHAESKACMFLRIVPGHLKNTRVYHSGPKNFNPAGMLTDAAAASPTEHTGHVHFRTRLREWEEAWAKADFRILAKHLAGKRQ